MKQVRPHTNVQRLLHKQGEHRRRRHKHLDRAHHQHTFRICWDGDGFETTQDEEHLFNSGERFHSESGYEELSKQTS